MTNRTQMNCWDGSHVIVSSNAQCTAIQKSSRKKSKTTEATTLRHTSSTLGWCWWRQSKRCACVCTLYMTDAAAVHKDINKSLTCRYWINDEVPINSTVMRFHWNPTKLYPTRSGRVPVQACKTRQWTRCNWNANTESTNSNDCYPNKQLVDEICMP